MRKLLFVFFYLFISFFALAQDKEVERESNILKIKELEKSKQYFLQSYSKVYIDYSKEKTIKDILQNAIQKEFKPLNIKQLDNNQNSYWIQCQFENLNADSLRIALYFMGFEHLRIYTLPSDSIDSLKATTLRPIATRSYKKYRDLTYLTIPSGKSTIYFHIVIEQGIYKNFLRSALNSFSFYRGDFQTFWTKNQGEIYAFTLLFLGGLGMMFFYNMVLFFMLWDKSYLFYILYLLFFGARVFVERDFYNDILAPEPPKYMLLLSLLFPMLFTLFQLLFTRSFLEVKRFLPWANRVIWVLISLIIVNLFLAFADRFVYFFQIFEITILLSNVVMLIIAVIVAYKQRKATTYFYLLGVVCLVVSLIVYVLVPASQYTIYTFNVALAGSLVEMALFSLGLANKINEAKKALIEQKLVQAQEREILIAEKNKELEIKVAQRTTELQASNATKDKLFSIISHDLRSPLNTLKGMLSALEANILNEKELQAITKDIQKRLDSTDTTLNDLLQWATSQMEGATVQKEVVNLASIVEQNIHLFSSIAENKQIAIVSNIAANTQVYADPNHLKIILRNLIANALKFTKANGTITVEVNRHLTDFVIIAIKDTGIGMTKEQSQKLFETNTLYTTRGTANEKGTGLGLLLCKDFVEKNGGQIWVESEDSKGSTFYFTLLRG